MYAFTFAVLSLVVSVSAAPTATVRSEYSRTVPLTGVTHSVVAGISGGFDPDNVVAEIGDTVEWHFLPNNRSVAQSSFAEPCQPLVDHGTSSYSGFFAGFNFATQEGQSPYVFQIVVEDKYPIWYYCPQQVGSHCQNGAVGVINQNYDNPAFSLRKHKELASQTCASVVPPEQCGGIIMPNPNPYSGY
ncbi:hypothetical protein JDV02_001914 [Purpureocillium takamizusanense]|uniref:Extracellular serine-rich protein n=1 Tax=Purpureocillium takamizusanense TaxID=2060973 RepID=A0A9Q8V826_9HYPO|nr:uncharacterized protein JDV02_001914 [Purpureocillium takamizusanense]UNI15377.1 hypothetical protein JDV02_001914 [Purpureocillium takamizusanense]